MKKSLTIWSLLLANFFSSSAEQKTNVDYLQHYAKISYKEDVSYVLSYPRSGNTLVRYIFEFVTGRPTMELRSHHDLMNIFLAYSLKELNVDLYAKPLWKVHRNRIITTQNFYAKERTKLLLLIRNYKEIVIRYSQLHDLPLFDDNEQLIEANLKLAFSIWDQGDGCELYFQNIHYFEQLDPNKRLLMYYEDLVANPHQAIDQITDFFNGSYERAAELKDRFEYYKKRIYAFYNENAGARSDVDDLTFYSKLLEQHQLDQIDGWVKEHHYYLWERYLRRYENS